MQIKEEDNCMGKGQMKEKGTGAEKERIKQGKSSLRKGYIKEER